MGNMKAYDAWYISPAYMVPRGMRYQVAIDCGKHGMRLVPIKRGQRIRVDLRKDDGPPKVTVLKR